MKRTLLMSGLSMLLALGASAQSGTPIFSPGKLAVLRGGDGLKPLAAGNKQNPMTICEYDPVTNLQVAPLVAVTLPTNNGTASMWFNASAGSEGQGISRSADRRYLAVTGYSSPVNQTYGTPSSAFLPGTTTPAFNRGIAIIDAFTNYTSIYSDPYNWFGLAPGVTQNNPRGIATADGASFWGAGTVAGTATGGYEESGDLFYNATDYNILGSPPVGTPFQSILQSTLFLRIVNNVLYATAQAGKSGALNNGIYTFATAIGNNPDPLPWMPGVSPYQGLTETTNLFCNFTTNAGILTFDMNSSNTVIYAADTTYGIVKFTGNGAGTFVEQYVFGPTNLGTTWTKGSQGAFGITVDFSQSTTNYNVIYATTLEEGDGSTISSNRLIRIVDTGAPGTTNFAQTLAVAGTNEDFRGLDFTPDLTPLITAQPSGASVGTNTTVALSVTVNSAYALTYQWQFNGVNLTDATNYSGSATGTLKIANTITNNTGNYTVIAANSYGAVTSSVAPVFVSQVPVLPGDFSPKFNATNYIGNTVFLTVNPTTGNQPFAYQWFFGATQLSDDGVKYAGSTTAALTITNVQLSDSGTYSVVVTNIAGAVTNNVETLTIQYVKPTLSAEPSSVVALAGQTSTLTVSAGGTAPLAFQWYQGNTKPVVALSDTGEFTGSATDALTITGVAAADATNYFCVVTNNGGSVTSTVASVTILVPPAPSYLAYSNQIYTQNFDSLPDPGSNNVNTVGGGGLIQIGTNFYNVANPFDFAAPTYTNVTSGGAGGLGLAATLSGWYGECDGDGAEGQLGASDGSQTTGGIISFGNIDSTQTNRALGLIATSTSGGTHFGLKLVNQSTQTLNYLTLQFLGQLWKQGTKPKGLQFSYYVDSASSPFNAAEIALATNSNPVASLSFSYPVGLVGAANGALAINQTNISATNLLISAWAPGQALWLVWSLSDPTGSGQGYAIDNLSFLATANPLVAVTTPVLGGATYDKAGQHLSLTFTNTAGAGSQFTIWGTTNLTLPLSQWRNFGSPTETAPGAYQFTDLQSTNVPAQYYRIQAVSPQNF